MRQVESIADVRRLRAALQADRVAFWRMDPQGDAEPGASDPPDWLAVSFRAPQDPQGPRRAQGAEGLALLPLALRSVTPAGATVLRIPVGNLGGLIAIWDDASRVPGHVDAIAAFARGVFEEHLTRPTREALESAQRRFTRVAEALPQGLILVPRGAEGGYVNAPAADLLRMQPGAASARALSEALQNLVERAQNAEEARAQIASMRARGDPAQALPSIWRFAQPPTALRVAHWPMDPQEEDGPSGWIWLIEDVSMAQHAEEQLRITARMFNQSGEAIVVTDVDGTIETINAAFTRSMGYSQAEAIGQPIALLNSGRQSAEFFRHLWGSLREVGFWQGEIWNRRKNGTIQGDWLTISRVTDDDQVPRHYVAVFADLTKVKESHRRAEYLSTHDTLTGLPNRTLFNDRLLHALAQMRRKQGRLALLFIDLDNFKTINDALGHDVGDELLVQAAHRLREAVRDVDTVARLGGDEFMAIVSDCTADSVDHIARRIVEGMSNTFFLRGRSLYASASVGVAFYPDDATEANEIVRCADAAMYRAKERGRNRVEFFKPDMHAQLLKRSRIESALREALHYDRLRLVFQPKYGLSAGNPLVGAEALVRLQDPDLGNIPPGDFIPVAEMSDLIVDVGRRVQRLLIEHIKEWRRRRLPVCRIAFNASARCVREPTFAEHLLRSIERADIPNDLVQVEITESALLESSETVVANLETLAVRDVCVAVDDFGTGYSSLGYLKRLPITELKIDRSFVNGLGHNKEDEAIARAVLALADALGLATVAEGVETPEQLGWLTRMGCEIAQGYHFAKPMEADEFARLLASHKTSGKSVQRPRARKTLRAGSGTKRSHVV